jgi:hypothetical protein
MRHSPFLLGLTFIAVISCGQQHESSSKIGKSDSVSTYGGSWGNAPDASEVDTSAPVQYWEYQENTDEMDGSVIKFASCKSINSVEFDFPYGGGSYLQLLVRKMKGRNEVILKISKGQFIGSYSETCKIKFDDGPVKEYSFNDAADGSSDYIFLESAASIIKQLKQAKHVKIQPTFYQAGKEVFDFDVSGLKWN